MDKVVLEPTELSSTAAPDRETRKMPPVTTLALLQAEHERLRSLQGTAMAVRKMNNRQWWAHLEQTLWLKARREG